MSEPKRMKANSHYPVERHSWEHDWNVSCDVGMHKCEPVEASGGIIEYPQPLVGESNPEVANPRPKLNAGDRVRHKSLGEGTIREVIEEYGTGSIAFDKDPKGSVLRHVAFNLLTKVEKSETLKEKLQRHAEPWKSIVAGTYLLIDSDEALGVFREHFDSKRDEMRARIPSLTDGFAAEIIDWFREILFGDEA